MKTVSQVLFEKHGISLRPGSERGKCPFCGHETFGIVKDDRYGKCFHPNCGRVMSSAGENPNVNIMNDILEEVFSDFRHVLFAQRDSDTEGAYSYLVKERKVHPLVVEQSLLGVVPASYSIMEKFVPHIRELEGQIRDEWKIRPGRQPKAKSEKEVMLDFLNDSQKKAEACFSRTGGWLCFFYTDANHRLVAIRLRKPYTKEVLLFKPHKEPYGDIMGVFGQELKQGSTDSLIVMEGEFNQLQLQSLAVRHAEANKIEPEYYHACAVGGVDNADYRTVRKISRQPVICYDNDESNGGFKLVMNALVTMSVLATTTPQPHNDMDEHIVSFGDDVDAAYKDVTAIIQGAVKYYRTYESVKAEIHHARQKKPGDTRQEFEVYKDVENIIIQDLYDRGTFYYEDTRAYLFLNEEKRLIPIESGNDDFRRLMHRYGINGSEKLYHYLAKSVSAEALEHGHKTEIYRLAHYDAERFTLYLFNNDSQVYRITPTEIELHDNGVDGVLFVNKTSAESFIMEPIEDGRSLLDEIIISRINFDTDELSPDDRRLLFTLWLLSLFFDSIFPTRPILALLGSHGAGKTTVGRMVLKLLFGRNADVTPLRQPDDFDTAVINSPYVVFDNVDDKREWLNDKLAIAATGGCIRKRKLYTDNEEIAIPIRSSIAITSRTPQFNRPDVAERLLMMKLERRTDYGSEHALQLEAMKNRNRIMSELVNHLQEALIALSEQRDIEVAGAFRMADFYDFCMRIASNADIEREVKSIFDRLSHEQSTFTLEDDPLFILLREWVTKNPDREVDAAGLLDGLRRIAEVKKAPLDSTRTAHSLGQWISHQKPNLDTYFDITSRNAGGHRRLYSFSPKVAEV